MKPSKLENRQANAKTGQIASGHVLPQNQHHNVKKEALGPNIKRSK